MFETSKHVPKTEKRCCVFKDNDKTINILILMHVAIVSQNSPSLK